MIQGHLMWIQWKNIVSQKIKFREGFKKFRVDYHYKEEYYDYEYFIPEHQILKQGHKMIDDGWNWIDGVDYIFCYEDYMKKIKIK